MSLPLAGPDDHGSPAGGGLRPSDTQSLRRGSAPIEIAHYRKILLFFFYIFVNKEDAPLPWTVMSLLKLKDMIKKKSSKEKLNF